MLGDGGPYLRSGQVAERAGVNQQTLRYYERRGLIAEPRRSPGGHRAYPPETVTLRTVIKAAQRLGFALEEVAELIDTGRRGHPIPDLRARAQDKIAEVDARIADLTTIRTVLTLVISVGCDSLTNCTWRKLSTRSVTVVAWSATSRRYWNGAVLGTSCLRSRPCRPRP